MRLRIVSPKELYAGLIFAGIGAFALVVSTDYSLGTTARVGPGYFPFCLSLALIGLGLGSVLRAVTVARSEPVGRWPLVPLAFILLGVVAFGLLIERSGLVAAGLVLLLLACYQRWRTRPIETLLVSSGLTGFVIAVFVYFLGMPLSLF